MSLAPFSYYYVAADGRIEGPIPSDELRQLRYAGQIGDDTPVIAHGEAEWGTYRSRVVTPMVSVILDSRSSTGEQSGAVLAGGVPLPRSAAAAPPAEPLTPSLLLRVVANPVSYVVGYLLFMLPTYVLPYLGSNSHLLRAGVQAINTDMGNRSGASALSIPFYLHLVCLGVLVALAFARGKRVTKPWLVVFPVLALAFDMLPGLTLIPLVPTAMHLAAIIAGVVGASGVRAGAAAQP